MKSEQDIREYLDQCRTDIEANRVPASEVRRMAVEIDTLEWVLEDE